MQRPILSYRSTRTLPQGAPHSGLGIVGLSIACLTTLLILATWAELRLCLLSFHADEILFMASGVLTLCTALIAPVGLLDSGVRRDFVFRALLLALINFLAMALLPMFVTA